MPSALAPATQPFLRCWWKCPSHAIITHHCCPNRVLQLSECEKSDSACFDQQLPMCQSLLGEPEVFKEHHVFGNLASSVFIP